MLPLRHNIEPTLPQIRRQRRSLIQRRRAPCKETLALLLIAPRGDSCRGIERARGHEGRRADEVVEDEGSVYQQPKPNNLQKRRRHHKHLPPQAQTNNPNRKRPTRIRQTPRRRAHTPSNTQPEEVEQRDAECDRQAAPEDRGRGDHLRPAAREVEERGERGDGGQSAEGEEEEHGESAEEAFEADGDEGGDGVAACGVTLVRYGTHSETGWKRK